MRAPGRSCRRCHRRAAAQRRSLRVRCGGLQRALRGRRRRSGRGRWHRGRGSRGRGARHGRRHPGRQRQRGRHRLGRPRPGVADGDRQRNRFATRDEPDGRGRSGSAEVRHGGWWRGRRLRRLRLRRRRLRPGRLRWSWRLLRGCGHRGRVGRERPRDLRDRGQPEGDGRHERGAGRRRRDGLPRRGAGRTGGARGGRGRRPGSGTAGDRQVPGGSRAEHERADDRVQRAVDLGQLAGQRPASVAAVQVVLDLRGLPLRQALPGPRAEPVHRRPAVLHAGRGLQLPEVDLQVRLPQSLPGAVGQGGDAVGRQTQQGRHLRRRLPFDLDVPEHGLPALRQPGERLGGQRALEPVDRGVGERDPDIGAGDLGDVGRQVQLLVPAGAVVGGVAHRREQVGAERRRRPAPRAQGVEDLRERLRHQVVGLRRGSGDLAGHVVRGGHVPLVELAVRVGRTVPHGLDQFRVAGPLHSCRRSCRHTAPSHPGRRPTPVGPPLPGCCSPSKTSTMSHVGRVNGGLNPKISVMYLNSGTPTPTPSWANRCCVPIAGSEKEGS